MQLYYNNIKTNISIDDPWFRQARDLYKRTFKDSEEFCDVVFQSVKALSISAYNNQVVSCAFIREKLLNVGGVFRKVAFMFGVATEENFRNQGFSRKVIENSFEHLKKEYDYLLLCPANFGLYGFYFKFGFEPLTYFSYKKGTIIPNGMNIIEGTINDAKQVYKIFLTENESLVAQQRSLDQTKTRLMEVFADNGKLFFVERDDEKIGYFLLEDGKIVSEHVNVDVKYDDASDYIIVDSSKNIVERERCPGVVVKSLNGNSIESIRGIRFYEMW